MAALMGWQMLWPLILGFSLSGVIQALVSKKRMSELLPDASFATLAKACGLGAASSSCSYAAVALARAVFRKGADFTAAMAFEMASTNLVLELGLVLLTLMGWRFMTAELVGAPLMIAVLALLFRALLKKPMLERARAQAERGRSGKMEGHATMDMAVTGGSLVQRLFTKKGFAATSQYFVMDILAIWKDIAIGLLLSGLIASLVPNAWWSALFLAGHPIGSKVIGPLVGPIVAMLSFVCSVGNVPLAAVLWNKGISFGGVVAFLFADLIVLPVLNIYRKYYGLRMSAFLLGTFYVSMVVAAFAIELTFSALGAIPQARSAEVEHMALSWNYTTFLNITFMLLAIALVVTFVRTGGPAMLRHMNGEPKQQRTSEIHSAT